MLYYGIVFVPMGFILALISTILRGRLMFYTLLICSGTALPALIIEGILVSGSGRGVRWENLLISMVIAAGTMLLVKLRVASGSA